MDTSDVLSLAAISISLFTFWYTSRRGNVVSTRPSSIVFNYECGNNAPDARIIFRSVLYSTGTRGNVVESLFLRVSSDTRQAVFSSWGFGENFAQRGGLFVPESGIVTDHRFLLPAWGDGDDSLFWLTEGTYTLELVAQLAGDSFFTKLRRRFRPLSLWKVSLVLPDLIRKNTSAAIAQISHADPTVSYSWSPETDRYQIDVKTHPRSR